MTIYEKLKNDHDHLKVALQKLANAEDAESRQRLIEQVRELLVPHSRAEEAVLYNTLRDMDEGKDVVSHGYQEHVMAETLLRGLQITEAVHLNWQAGVEKLKHDIGHHIAEEENKIFAVARRVLSEHEANAMGKAFDAIKPQMGTNVVSSNFELVVNLMPERLRKTFGDNLNKH